MLSSVVPFRSRFSLSVFVLASSILLACGGPASSGPELDGSSPADSGQTDGSWDDEHDAMVVVSDAMAVEPDDSEDAGPTCGDPCLPNLHCGTVHDACDREVVCGLCDDGYLCSDHQCVKTCSGCVIDGACLRDGERNPTNPCQVCQVASSKLAWSVLHDGVTCDDGDVCTLDDACQTGACVGTAKQCDDGVDCNGAETCDAHTGSCEAGQSQCVAPLLCRVESDACEPSCEGGCVIAGVCRAANATNPLRPCEACLPNVNRTAWSPLTGNPCGEAGECFDAGFCWSDGLCHQAAKAVETPCGAGSSACMHRACNGFGTCVTEAEPLGTDCSLTTILCDLPDTCDGLGVCVDRGPSPVTQSCGGVGTCNGSASAPACSCPEGFRWSNGQCVDIDECAEKLDDCDRSPAACVNEPGGFSCECPAEFDGDGIGKLGCTCDLPGASPICRPWTSVSPALNTHGCAISEGALFCWGGNEDGQLGVGDLVSRIAPTRVGDAYDWDAVSAGYEHTCGLRGGALYCWGDSYAYGQTQNPSVPARIGTDSDWTEVGTALGSTCGLRDDGHIYCWGYAFSINGGPVGGFEKLSVGFTSACAIRNGALYCWGNNDNGELGDGTTVDKIEPTRVGTLNDWVHVDTAATTCAVRANGEVYCWGLAYTNTPTLIAGVTGAETVAAGSGFGCARLEDGTGKCWGRGFINTLGTLEWSLMASPTPLTPAAGWDTIEAANYHGCGLRSGSLYCWGDNELGARGTGPDFGRVGTASDWTHVSVGIINGCGLRGDGELYCWGDPRRLGAFSGAMSMEPRAIEAGSNWLDVSTGGDVICAIREPGELYCWGTSDYGALGQGQGVTSQATPTRVGTASDWKRVSAGWFQFCGIRGDGDLYCWGQPNFVNPVYRYVPTLISQLGWTEVDAGYDSICGVRGNQLIGGGGGATTGVHRSPAAGFYHGCAITDGKLYCWGSNTSGQLGLGSQDNQNHARTQVGSATDWSVVGAFGSYSTSGIQGGRAYSWGDNDYGQLGSGDFIPRNAPSRIGDAADWEYIDVGNEAACGIRAGALYCWGKNDNGVLGHPAGLLPTLVLDPTTL